MPAAALIVVLRVRVAVNTFLLFRYARACRPIVIGDMIVRAMPVNGDAVAATIADVFFIARVMNKRQDKNADELR